MKRIRRDATIGCAARGNQKSLGFIEYLRELGEPVKPPNRLEKWIRFGCGFVFGCFFFICALLTSLSSAQSFAASCLFIGLICGFRSAEVRREVLGPRASSVDVVVNDKGTS